MMQDNKKAARGATNTTDSRVETGPASQAVPHLHQQSTTPAPLGQAVKIADFLSRGETNALPLRHLRDLLHLPARTIRLIIRAERMSRTPILESSKADGGYYLPGNDHERARCVQRLRRRAAEIVKVANAIEEAGI